MTEIIEAEFVGGPKDGGYFQLHPLNNLYGQYEKTDAGWYTIHCDPAGRRTMHWRQPKREDT